MSAPSTTVSKPNAIAAQANQSAIGILAIVAPCLGSANLPANTPQQYSDTGALQSAGQEGPLVEFGAYFIEEAQLPCLVVRPTTTTAGSYSPADPALCGGTAGLQVAAVPSNGPPAHITVTGHGLVGGTNVSYVVTITGATGDTAINGTWDATVVDANTLSLTGVTGSGAYTANSATIVYTGVSYTGTGTSVVSVGSAAAIADDYQVLVNVVTGGTLGVAGIILQVSLDGGALFGPQIQLGTAMTLTPTVPVTGVSTGVVLNFGTGTFVTGDQFAVNVTGPRMNSSDLTSALAALKATKLQWDCLLVHGETTSALVGVVDAWITGLGAIGLFPFAFMNTRHKYLPNTQSYQVESDASFQTAMSSLLSSTSTINVAVGTDAADMVSPISGVTKPQPISLYLATRAESTPIGQDAAYVGAGPLGLCSINFPNGNSKWHDEQVQAGLDSTTIRLVTLRTFPRRSGVYICNPYVLSGNGSPYVYVQHARTMNAACQAAYDEMTGLLSAGYERSTTTGKITKRQALDWQSRGQQVINQAVAGQVSGTEFIVSQNDINLGNGPATITCTLENEALGY